MEVSVRPLYLIANSVVVHRVPQSVAIFLCVLQVCLVK